jgi:hypothetical protein
VPGAAARVQAESGEARHHRAQRQASFDARFWIRAYAFLGPEFSQGGCAGMVFSVAERSLEVHFRALITTAGFPTFSSAVNE